MLGSPTFLTFHHTPQKKGRGLELKISTPKNISTYHIPSWGKGKNNTNSSKLREKGWKKGICFWDLHLPHPGCQSQVVKVSGLGFSGSWVGRCDPWYRPRKRTPLRLQHRSKAKYQVNVLLMAENPVNSTVEVKVGSLSIYIYLPCIYDVF